MNDAKNETVTAVSELKPCPFCGAPGVLVQVPAEFGPRYRVDCSRACESARLVGNAFAAIEAWNRRSALSPSPAPVTPVSELKPCPFCGEPERFSFEQDRCVICVECGASSPICDNVVQAAAAWNRRSALADVGECKNPECEDGQVPTQSACWKPCPDCTGKQPRPAAEAPRRDPNTSYETLEEQIGRDCSPAAHTAQLTEEERDVSS